MRSRVGSAPPPATAQFRHEALLYAGIDEFVKKIGTFVAAGIRAEEPTLVVVSAEKIERLQAALGRDAHKVQFADMREVGRNPARIIPAWIDFVAAHEGVPGPLRGVGEPVGAARTPDELVECQRHESLLNLAFDAGRPWWLVCPYDMSVLSPNVLEEALRSHPFVAENGSRSASGTYRGPSEIGAPFDGPLPDPPGPFEELAFESGRLLDVRELVTRNAVLLGLDQARTADAVLAVNEIATNSLRHGGGSGVIRLWHEADRMVVEIRDSGRIDQPLAGRIRPANAQEGGLGLWLANQLCDLVQIRSFEAGSVVRLHIRR